MPNVVLKREGGLTIEADLTFEQIKELVGVNGHAAAIPIRAVPEPHPQKSLPGIPDFEGFYSALPPRGKKFIDYMREHPKGIEASVLAPLLGFVNANQIGGLTGGGLAKMAARYSVSMGDVYATDVKFPGGKRKRMFYPGKFLKGK